ncbi:hypothetical protein LSH36_268g03005, partial [Paralvinella palmiformis]
MTMILHRYLTIHNKCFCRKHSIKSLLQILEPSTEEVHVKGWVKSLRDRKDV